MRAAAINWAYKVKTRNIGEKAVLAYLADLANKDGQCWARQETIAAALDTSEKTICRHMRALEADGLIARKGRYDKKKGCRTSDMTRLLIPDNLTGKGESKTDNLTGKGESKTDNLTVRAGGKTDKLSENPSTKNLTREEEERVGAHAPTPSPSADSILPVKEERGEPVSRTTRTTRTTRTARVKETRLSADFQLDAANIALAAELDVDLARSLARFVRHFTEIKPNAICANWQAKFRSWLENEHPPKEGERSDGSAARYNDGPPQPPEPGLPTHEELTEKYRSLAAQSARDASNGKRSGSRSCVDAARDLANFFADNPGANFGDIPGASRAANGGRAKNVHDAARNQHEWFKALNAPPPKFDRTIEHEECVPAPPWR